MVGSPSFERFVATRHFESLDGLRAVAIAAVVWHHAAGPAGRFVARSHGVTLFFILSGFLITTLLRREQWNTGGISVRPFYLRRILRIFPLYYTVAAVYVVLVLALWRDTPEGRAFLHNLPYYLTFTSDWFVDYRAGTRVIFYFAWSLAVQEQFYAAWPWVMRATRSWRLPVAVATGLLVTGEAARWLTAHGVLPTARVLRPLTAIASPIFLGSIVAALTHTRRGFDALAWVAGRAWSQTLALLLIALPLAWPRAPLLLTSVALTLLVASCVVRPDHRLRPLLENRVVRGVGAVSFGIYLTHMLALNLVRRLVPGAPGWERFALTMVASTGAASLSYRYLERPFLRLKDVLSRVALTRLAIGRGSAAGDA